jgi:hypothetical protein
MSLCACMFTLVSVCLSMDGSTRARNDTIKIAGSGQGVVGIAAAMCGAEKVMLTDVAPALPSIQRNIVLNHVEVVVGRATKSALLPMSWQKCCTASCSRCALFRYMRWASASIDKSYVVHVRCRNEPGAWKSTGSKLKITSCASLQLVRRKLEINK